MMLMWIVPVLLLVLLLDRPNRWRSWGITVPLLAVGLLLMPLTTMWGMGSMMHRYRIWNWQSALVLAVIIAAMGGVAYALSRRNPVESEEMHLIRMRLARGEITEEEYERLRQVISR